MTAADPRNTTGGLFSPFTIRGITFRNRIGVSPMCQYSCEDGLANEWHLVHLGSRAVGGAGLVIVEATAVEARGRITPGDLGLWSDAQIEPLARVARFIHSQGGVTGIQLAHAGRKASTATPWQGGALLAPSQGGWADVVAPSALTYAPGYAQPIEISAEGIAGVVRGFGDAARRAREAGCRVIEIHAAHGYLLHSFFSPLSNRRTDAYGGSFENRTRIGREVVEAVRRNWPERYPLFLRISATDWSAGGWDVEQSIELVRVLRGLGVDLVDCSSGGNVHDAKVPVGPGYQVQFAAAVKRAVGMPTAAVGLITTAAQAEEIVRSGQADMVLLARQLLRDAYWPLHAAIELGQAESWPAQYLRAAPAGSAMRKQFEGD